ncbi:MAG TPA: cytochrome c biogenesis protein ResB [Candidatus Saccharicenans sp.]|nr:cytochrome c biogenesis protein ResB [Candidatus Saccharicenans sp.]
MIRFLSSLKLAIFLLSLIILLSVIGTLIPQGEDPGFYQTYLPRWSGIILSLQLDHLYRSPLFLSVAFFFLLNILFCSLRQLPVKLKQLPGEIKFIPPGVQSAAVRKLASSFSDWFEASPDSLLAELRQRHYQVKIKKSGEKKTLLAQKERPGLFGPEIVHLAIMIIIVGGLISALFSQRIELALTEGQTADLPGKNFSLRLERFTTDYYPDGSIKSWKSLVSILEQGQVKKQKIIEVNHPLKYDGLNFFQMSYGFDWDRTKVGLEIISGNSAVRQLSLKVGEKVQLDSSLTLSLLNFIPDFTLDPGGRPTSRSAEANNPAALVLVTREGTPVYQGWLFYYHPESNQIQQQPGLELAISLKKFEAPLFSGLEAASDPGLNLVWLGCALLFLGLLICFYLNYRQMVIGLRPGEKPVFSAHSRHNQTTFYQELERLLEVRPDSAINSDRKNEGKTK